MFLVIFDRMMITWPLFDRKTFMERYSRKYPVKCSEDPAWYACLNICFALATIMRKEELPGSSPRTPQTTKSTGPEELENMAWWRWLRNAASTFVDMQFGPPSLMAVQAMSGLVTLSPSACIMERINLILGIHSRHTVRSISIFCCICSSDSTCTNHWPPS